LALGAALALSTTSALADDSDGLRAAGFAIIGIGGALGAGSIGTGIALSNPNNDPEQQRLANATWIGGAITLGVSLLVGLPLVLHSSSTDKKSSSEESTARLVEAFSGRVRF
jgi:hypothetical protein